MKVRKCDGCGIISPDDDGLYIANGWTCVKVAGGSTEHWDKTHQFEFCGECLPRKNKLMRDIPIGNIIKAIRKYIFCNDKPTQPKQGE